MDPVAFSRITVPELIAAPRVEQERGSQPGSFADLLGSAIARVREVQTEADQEVRKFLAGEPVELHRVMLAGEKATLASELMMAVRNKAVDAYQEIMRIQV